MEASRRQGRSYAWWHSLRPPERCKLGGGGEGSRPQGGVSREVAGQPRGITGRAAGVAIGRAGRTRSPATCGCGAASGGGIWAKAARDWPAEVSRSSVMLPRAGGPGATSGAGPWIGVPSI